MQQFASLSTAIKFLKTAKFWLGYLAVSILAVLVFIPNFAIASTDNSSTSPSVVSERVIGVLALNGSQRALELWTPMIDYLNNQADSYRYRLKPLEFSQIESQVKNARIDFLIANPALYAALEKKYDIFRLVTLVRQINGQKVDKFGGVIISREGVDVKNVLSLHQEAIAAVDSYSFGGYLLQKQMIREQLKIPINDNRVTFYHNHQHVVNAVIAGDKQVGFIRTGVLEWVDKARQLSVFSTEQTPAFPLQVSTRLFPEWPLASLTHIRNDEAASLVQLLLRWQSPVMTTDIDERLSWTVPQNYLAVHQLLRDFRIEPYEQLPQLSFDEWLKQYKEWSYFLGALLLGLVLMSGLIGRTTQRRLRHSESAVKQSKELQNKILELEQKSQALYLEKERLQAVNNAVHNGVLVFSISGRVLFSNEVSSELLGYSQNEFAQMNIYHLFLDHFDRDHLHALVSALDGSDKSVQPIEHHIARLINHSNQTVSLRISITPVKHNMDWWLIMHLENVEHELQLMKIAKRSSRLAALYMEASGALVFTCSADFKLLSVNQRIREMFHLQANGRLKEVSLADSDILLDVRQAEIFWLDEWVPEESRAALQHLLSELPLPTTPSQIHFDWHFSYRDQVVQLNLTCVYINDSNLEEPFYLCVAHDVSELRETSKQLALSRKNFDSVVLKSQTGILVIDSLGEVKFANEAVEELMGRAREQIVGTQFALPVDMNLEMHNEVDIVHDDGSTGIAEVTYNETEWEGQKAYLVLMYDITQLKKAQQAIEYEATHDSLTQLPNRRFFQEALGQAISRASNTNEQFALLYLDLDRFKDINDTLGHQVGDELLINVALRLKSVLRQSDLLARMGGDEFTILLEGIRGTESVQRICGNLTAELEKPIEIEGHQIYSGCSLGIAIYPTHSRYAEELLKMADAAMYDAKHNSAKKYIFFRDELLKDSQNRFNLETELNKAVAEQQFVLHYQPQFRLKEQQFNSFEALIRWQHPEHGMIAPDRFISLLETTGKIHKVGEWVLRQAIADFQSWFGDTKVEHRMGVNVSTIQLINSDFVKLLQQILQETGFNPHNLAIEVTESSFVKNHFVMAKTLHRLRELGVEIQMDDFGTGYSSLYRLKNLPFDVVKIDQSFVRQIIDDERDRIMVCGAIQTIHAFGMKVVVEGVEHEEQRKVLEEVGCDSMQGYLFSRPIPADELYKNFIQADNFDNL
ncbi:diguanylate cyclase [uncultured Thiomicrorhabdus sp.]